MKAVQTIKVCFTLFLYNSILKVSSSDLNVKNLVKESQKGENQVRTGETTVLKICHTLKSFQGRLELKLLDNGINLTHITIPKWLQAETSPEKLEYLRSKAHLYSLDPFEFVVKAESLNCSEFETKESVTFARNVLKTHQKNESRPEEESNGKYSSDVATQDLNSGATFSPNNGSLEESEHMTMEFEKQFFTPDGFFFAEEFRFASNKFCIDNLQEEEIEVSVCLPRNSSLNKEDGENGDVIIPKCCPPGFTLQYHTDYPDYAPSCIETPYANDWSPEFYNVDDPSEKTKASDASKFYFKYLDMNSFCGDTGLDFLTPYRKVPKPLVSDLRILENGKVLARRTGNHRWDKPKVHRTNYVEDYCLDSLVDSAAWNSATPNYSTELPALYPVIVFCRGEAQEDYVVTHATVFFAILFPSSLVLLLIVIVYGLIWTSQNVHGWTIGAYSFTMLLWFIFRAFAAGIGVFEYKDIDAGSDGCIFIAILNHFFYIATFCWLTILNFDLWSTISSMTPLSARSKGKGRFGIYCLVGYGIPTIILIISLIIESEFGLFDDSVIRPQYGHASCELDKTSIPYYAIIPNFILCIANTAFAILTLKFLLNFNRNSVKLDKSATTSNKQQALFIGKLFTLMGFTWVLELIPNLLEKNDVTWYWSMFQLYNMVQVVGLFCIFVCKKEIKNQLCSKYKIFNDCFSAWEARFEKQQDGTASTSTTMSEVQV